MDNAGLVEVPFAEREHANGVEITLAAKSAEFGCNFLSRLPWATKVGGAANGRVATLLEV